VDAQRFPFLTKIVDSEGLIPHKKTAFAVFVKQQGGFVSEA
jgi:hypothetical protein